MQVLGHPMVTRHPGDTVKVYNLLGSSTAVASLEWQGSSTPVQAAYLHPTEMKSGGRSAHQGEHLNFNKQDDMK